jgi:hypothetical protein
MLTLFSFIEDITRQNENNNENSTSQFKKIFVFK